MLANHFRSALLLLTLCTSVSLFAQDDDEKTEKSWNGIRAGYHMSNFDGDGSADDRSGYYVGYYRNLLKIPLYSLSSGLEFHTAGATEDPVEVRLSYLSMPINNRFKLGPVYLDLGADLALKVHERTLVDGSEVDIEGDSGAQSVDVLVHGGLGFKILKIGIEARYRRGLTDVYPDSQNTGLELGLSFFF